MNGNLTDILKEGFELWKNNPVLGIPPLLSWIIRYGLWFIAGIVIMFAVLGVGLGAVSLSENIENINALIQSLGAAAVFIFLIAAFLIVITLLIDAFFKAGLIGMSKEAIETGKTEISTMVECGKRKFIPVFFANLIILILSLLPLIITGIIFLILIASGAASIESFSDAEIVKYTFLFLLLLAIFLLWILYATVIDIIFAVAIYAVVISDTGALEGLKAGFRFFMKNKLDVFLMWLIILCISFVFGSIYYMIQMFLSFIPIIGAVIGFVLWVVFYVFMAAVFTPITALWWSRIYMDGGEINKKLTI